MIIKSKFAFLSLIFFSTASVAQQTWTLQKCIEYSLEHSIPAKQAELNAELSKSRLQQSYAEFLPSVNGYASHNYNWGKSIDQFALRFVDQRTQTNNFNLSSSVILFNGFQLQNTQKQSSYEYLASKKDIEQTKNDIALNVITQYLQVLYNTEFVKISQSTLDATQKQLDRITILVAAGALSQSNKLDIEAQLASDELNVVNSKNRLVMSFLELTQAMNLDSVNNFIIDKPDMTNYQYALLDMKPEDIYTIALQNQPSVKSSEFKSLSANAGLAVARGTRSPRLSLSGGYGSGYSDARQRVKGFENPASSFFGYVNNFPVYYTPAVGEPIYEKTPFSNQIKDNLNKSVGLTLNLPLFNGWQSRTTIARAKINFQQAELNVQQTKNQLYKTIQQTHADASAALKKFSASARQVNAMKESFKYTEEKFNLGLVNSIEFLISKNNLERAESELLQSRFEYLFKSKILDFYLGKQLTF